MNWRQVAADLQAARQLLRERGWIQGDYEYDGRFCAEGALCAAKSVEFNLSVIDPAYRALSAVTDGPSVPIWNDAIERTLTEVLAAFDAATSLALSEAEVTP